MRRMVLALAGAVLAGAAVAQEAGEVTEAQERAALAAPSPLAPTGALPAVILQGLRCHKVLEHTDGDTIVISISGGGVAALRARVREFDAPEMRGSCEEERSLAQEARDLLVRLTSPCVYVLSDLTKDRYGRELVWLFSRDGRSVSSQMIAAGLAHPYTGTGARQPWCAPARPSRR